MLEHVFEKDKVKLQQNVRDYRVPYSQLFQGSTVIFSNAEVLTVLADKALHFSCPIFQAILAFCSTIS